MKKLSSLLVCALILSVPAANAQTSSRPRWNLYTIKDDGTITNIRVVAGLRGGLTERSIEAARKIKFIPATKDGKPVSMWMQLEYNYNLY